MSKKARMLTGIIGAASVVLLVIIAAYYFTRAYNPPRTPDFQGYKPSVLPAGVAITGDGLERTDYHDQGYSRFSYGVGLNNDELRIIEAKAESYTPKVVTCKGIGNPCRELVTAVGQHYTVSYGEYQNKPFSLTVNWVKNGTDISLSADDKVIDKYLRYDWGPVIDSFAPVDFNSMKLQTREGHCCGG